MASRRKIPEMLKSLDPRIVYTLIKNWRTTERINEREQRAEQKDANLRAQFRLAGSVYGRLPIPPPPTLSPNDYAGAEYILLGVRQIKGRRPDGSAELTDAEWAMYNARYPGGAGAEPGNPGGAGAEPGNPGGEDPGPLN